MGDRSKLPKWARDELDVLERQVTALTADLAVGPAESDTFADPHGTPRPLGRATLVRFGSPDHEVYGDRVYFDVWLEGDALRVRCGGGTLVVMPDVSNAARCGVLTHDGDIAGLPDYALNARARVRRTTG